MHPAYSIIIFTTLTGIGYGLGAMLGLGLLAGSTAGLVVGYGLSLVLVSVGLLSSTGHLRHPERAWRALSQWRSSWLSREGVLAILTFIPLGLSGGASFLGFDGAATGIVGTVLCVATVVATSMIYASGPSGPGTRRSPRPHFWLSRPPVGLSRPRLSPVLPARDARCCTAPPRSRWLAPGA